MTISKETIEKARQARENRNVEEAERIARELPEIPPLEEGDVVVTFIPKRQKQGGRKGRGRK